MVFQSCRAPGHSRLLVVYLDELSGVAAAREFCNLLEILLAMEIWEIDYVKTLKFQRISMATQLNGGLAV